MCISATKSIQTFCGLTFVTETGARLPVTEQMSQYWCKEKRESISTRSQSRKVSVPTASRHSETIVKECRCRNDNPEGLKSLKTNLCRVGYFLWAGSDRCHCEPDWLPSTSMRQSQDEAFLMFPRGGSVETRKAPPRAYTHSKELLKERTIFRPSCQLSCTEDG